MSFGDFNFSKCISLHAIWRENSLEQESFKCKNYCYISKIKVNTKL